MTQLPVDQQDALSDREREILALLADGLTNQEIANRLHLALPTIKWYNTQIYEKLGVQNREAAVQLAHTRGLLVPDALPDGINAKHNLPQYPTPFIGREAELAAIAHLLDNGARLLTILGIGGMGKTRLALETARRRLLRYRDGAYVVLLAPVSTANGLIAAIAYAIGYQFQKEIRSPLQQLTDYLAGKDMLLVLDNFEHLLDGAPHLTDIMQAAPGVQMIATSREKLNLRGEMVYTLTGLSLPDWKTPEDALKTDAMQLFIQSAHRVRPDYELTGDDLDVIARVCRLVGGMPLGIELATSWMDTLSLPQIADEIQRDIDILETEMRDMPERHRSIRATFNYSWSRLNDDERTAFMGMTVFRGGFTAEAAEAVAGANARLLRKLVNKALLYLTPDNRYELHELLRQFGEEQLIEAGAIDSVRDRHADFFADKLHQLWNPMDAVYKPRLDYVAREYKNVIAAWLRMCEGRQVANLQKTLRILDEFLGNYGRLHEARMLYQHAIDQLQPLRSDRDAGILKGEIQARMARLIMGLDQEEGRAIMVETVAYLEQFGPSVPLLWGYIFLGNLFSRGPTTIWEEDQLQKALDIADAVNDFEARIFVLHILGYARLEQGDFDEAKRLGEEALVAANSIGHKWLELAGKSLLGRVLPHFGEHERAIHYLQECLDVEIANEFLYGISEAATGIAELHLSLDNIPAAKAQMALILDWHERVGQDWQILGYLGAGAAWFVGRLGYLERAVELVAFVQQHPATVKLSREFAKNSLEEYAARLPDDIYQAALERGQHLTLPEASRSLRAVLEK